MQNFDTQIQAYDYDLPSALIAQEPVYPRDSSRLLVIDKKKGSWEHHQFKELPRLLDSKDMIVANNSRVLKARLLGYRLRQEKGQWVEGGRVEFLMLERIRSNVWEGLFHASANYVPGLRFVIPTPNGKNLQGVLIRGSADSSTGTVVVEFDEDPTEINAGEIPLPHYVERPITPQDENSYQTIYSKVLGSAAAPTAGLHFTPHVLEELSHQGISWLEISLHVGIGTFRPVKTQDIREHKMHEELFEISTEVADKVNDWKKNQGRILAVGTTSVRALESSWLASLQMNTGLGPCVLPGKRRTAIFIHPGASEIPGEYPFHVVDRLLTNFHLPKSSLLMLVSAFAGRELIMEAYHEAIREKYRFFSYGDAMLII